MLISGTTLLSESLFSFWFGSLSISPTTFASPYCTLSLLRCGTSLILLILHITILMSPMSNKRLAIPTRTGYTIVCQHTQSAKCRLILIRTICTSFWRISAFIPCHRFRNRSCRYVQKCPFIRETSNTIFGILVSGSITPVSARQHSSSRCLLKNSATSHSKLFSVHSVRTANAL